MPNISKQIESIFAAAIELSGEPREAFLDRECAGHEGLRQQLDGLLQAHDRVNHQLDHPIVANHGMDSTLISNPQMVGAIIAGRYKLLEQIGDGGMGTVWMAEQKEPVKRLVAVKLIKAGMDSKAVLARFEAERQALALMDHPNIAKVHDAGTDDNGRPYFAMELVKGLPLTEYCDARKLSVSERLDLFVQICSAVQHAHQKAIIHRDLKPANVLVTEHDGRAVPKVIDFGLAKALNSSQMLTERTLHTAYGTVVGTPLYMAPEQVGINALDVDTRTDIYALGVILYELLTGTTPLEKARFREVAWEEVKRLIREEEPPRPSLRLSTDKTLPSLAASRQVDAGKLAGLVRGELDWIVMKALEKDRTRRYDTANGLAKDVQRYLKGDTVEACPPSFGYRLRKAYRRNKPAVLVTSAFVGLITIAAVMGVFLAIRAEQARRGEVAERRKAEQREAEANEQRALAMQEQRRAEEEKRRAEEEKRAAEAVRSFLQDDLLRQADIIKQAESMPRTGDDFEIKLNPTINELLDRAAAQLTEERIEQKFPNLPFVQAEVLHAVASAYTGIGQDEKARPLIDRAVPLYLASRGPDDRATLASRVTQASICGQMDGREKGEQMLAAVAEDCRRVFGSRDRMGFDAAIWYGRSLAIDNPSEAIPYLQKLKSEGIEYYGGDDSLTILSAGHLAMAYRLAGRIPEAIREMEEVLEKVRNARVRPDYPWFVAGFGELADAYSASNRPDKAIEVWREVIRQWELRGQQFHHGTWFARHEIGLLHAREGETEVALQLFQENVQAAPLPPFVMLSNYEARRMAIILGREDDALEFARSGLAAMLSGQPTLRNWYTGMARLQVGELLLKRNEYAEAESLLLAAVADLVEFNHSRASFDQGGMAAAAHRALTELYTMTNRPADATRIRASHAELIASGEIKGGKPWDIFSAGDYELAASTFEAEAKTASSAEAKSKAYHGLFLSEQKLGWADDARMHAQAAIDVIIAARGPKHRSYQLGRARSALGVLLCELKDPIAAEPHLLDGCREVADHANQIPAYDYPHRVDAFVWLIHILEQSNRAAEAEKWVLEWQQIFGGLLQKTLHNGKLSAATVDLVEQSVLMNTSVARHKEALALFQEVNARYLPANKATADAWLTLSGNVFNNYEGELRQDLMKPWAELRIPALERNLNTLRESNPSELELLRATNRLLFSYLHADRTADTIRLAEEVIARHTAIGWKSDAETVNSYGSTAKSVTLAGRPDLAVEMSLAVLTEVQKSNPSPEVLATATFSLGFARFHANQHAKSEEHFREALRLQSELNGKHWKAAKYKAWLGFALHELKMYSDAESVLNEAYSDWEQQSASTPAWEKQHPLLIAVRMASLYEAIGNPNEAAKWKTRSEQK
ncbi:MAG: serine/threonine protein kinase [Planctomyces sp.]|nr:serine/threonine protein kinase [Planctomyces sp.]